MKVFAVEGVTYIEVRTGWFRKRLYMVPPRNSYNPMDPAVFEVSFCGPPPPYKKSEEPVIQ